MSSPARSWLTAGARLAAPVGRRSVVRAGCPQRRSLPLWLLAGSFCLRALAVVTLVLPRISIGALDVRVLVWMLAAVAFLVPDRFAIAASLPIDLEPYRILFGFITLIWVVVLLTNPEARFRRTLLDLPLLLMLSSILASVIAEWSG